MEDIKLNEESQIENNVNNEESLEENENAINKENKWIINIEKERKFCTILKY